MKKDIQPPEVKDIALAIVREPARPDTLVQDISRAASQGEWNVYILNLKQEFIEGVLVTSKGYGFYKGKDVKTSTLRHFLDTIPSMGYARVEPIVENLFGLNNEYWVSFFINKVMYDKKYVFLAESVREENLIQIPLLNKRGVMIR